MLIFVYVCVAFVHFSSATFTRGDVLRDEFGGVDPMASADLSIMFTGPKANILSTVNEGIDSFIGSATEENGAVRAGVTSALKVVESIGTNAAKFKSGDTLQIMEGVMGVMATIASLVPGGQPFALCLSMLTVAFGLANGAKSETEKLCDFITEALWDSNARADKVQVKKFLVMNKDTMVVNHAMIENEENGTAMITYEGLKDSMNGAFTHYGSNEIETLWSSIEDKINEMKTAANGLKIYNMIFQYVKAVMLRDIALMQFLLAYEKATTRNCTKTPSRKCRPLSESDRSKLDSVYNNVRVQMNTNKNSKYTRVGQILETNIQVSHAAVLVHHHPINWSPQSRFIHNFTLKHAELGPSSYLGTWENNNGRQYVFQHVKYATNHMEPEDQTGGREDILELEDSACHINYGVTLEKIYDEDNNETNGYFTMKMPKYDTSDPANWNSQGILRYYLPTWASHTSAYWFRLQHPIPDVEVYLGNSSQIANQYLYIVLIQEKSHEARCGGDKPKMVIIPKMERDKFFTYDHRWQEMEYRIQGYATVGDYTPWYLHDCQGLTGCPGCHTANYRPATVEGTDCPVTSREKKRKAKKEKAKSKKHHKNTA